MTSDERREVAERIRALPSDIYSTIKEWEKDGLFIGATLCDEADYSQIHNAVFGCFPPEYIHPGDREELHERLADLIDPTCHVIPGKAVAELKDGTRLTGVLLSCGHAVFGVSAKDMPRFCCECGARITNEVGDD